MPTTLGSKGKKRFWQCRLYFAHLTEVRHLNISSPRNRRKAKKGKRLPRRTVLPARHSAVLLPSPPLLRRQHLSVLIRTPHLISTWTILYPTAILDPISANRGRPDSDETLIGLRILAKPPQQPQRYHRYVTRRLCCGHLPHWNYLSLCFQCWFFVPTHHRRHLPSLSPSTCVCGLRG